jgi:hypothetical protein
MSADRPMNVDEMMAWLRAHPDQPFFSLWSGKRLLIGTRNDSGEIVAWDCTVNEDRFAFDRARSSVPGAGGREQ